MLTVYLIMEFKFVRLVKKIFLDILLIVRHWPSPLTYYRYSNFNKVSILKFFVAYANELVYLIGEQKKLEQRLFYQYQLSVNANIDYNFRFVFVNMSRKRINL